MKKTRVKLASDNKVHISSVLIHSNQDIIDAITDIMEESFIDDKHKVWIKGREIGKGGFSSVYYCRNDAFAALKFSKSESEHARELKAYMCLGSSSFIPRLIGYNKDNKLLILQKYEMDLKKMLTMNPCTNQLHRISQNVIDSLRYIHSHGVVHCDIKPANIFISTSGTATIGDFGLSRENKDRVYNIDPSLMREGTLKYMSSDMCSRVHPTRRSDMESFGWVLVEMYGGVLPWTFVSDHEKDKVIKRTTVSNLIIRFDGNIAPWFSGEVPSKVADYIRIVSNLDYNECPDYNLLKQLFVNP